VAAGTGDRIGIVAAVVIVASPGWQWLPYVYLAKLVLGHAVPERPIRPGAGPC